MTTPTAGGNHQHANRTTGWTNHRRSVSAYEKDSGASPLHSASVGSAQDVAQQKGERKKAHRGESCGRTTQETRRVGRCVREKHTKLHPGHGGIRAKPRRSLTLSLKNMHEQFMRKLEREPRQTACSPRARPHQKAEIGNRQQAECDKSTLNREACAW